MLFEKKIIVFPLLLLEFIFDSSQSRASLLVAGNKWNDFGCLSSHFKLSANGLSLKTNEFAKYRKRIANFPYSVGKNPLRYRKKRGENTKMFSESVANPFDVTASSFESSISSFEVAVNSSESIANSSLFFANS
ncbi:hypothetical protein [Sphingobacterium corticibacterium]|uniref:Uncharacterized protein n=1 Tax=Sphingobacterium corticibacterium TaxID=2484746 RepID=A0A4Q6XNF7_9SPHI|nr:hypothetical protein [Sphingobacterium corticibacterium]RZF61693.1 hypothetical protein EWE74_02305 [Sphingobacterium corticibacterium]